jgi:hypothetical protein
MKEVVLALEKVWPEAAGRTCCFEEIIESSNFAKKSMSRRGMAGETGGTAAKTPGGNLLAFSSCKVRTWAATDWNEVKLIAMRQNQPKI